MKVQLSPCLRCARLWLLLPVLKYSLEGQCGAGGSTYVAAHERYPNPAALPDRNTHGARCRSCHLCGSSGLVYSLSHQAHEREAAAGTGCIYLCLHHAVLGTAPAARQAVGTASSSLLQSGFPIQSVAQREGSFPDRNPSPSSFHSSPMWQNKLNSLAVVPQGGAFHQLFMLCVLTVLKFC